MRDGCRRCQACEIVTLVKSESGADRARERDSTPLPFGVALGHRLRQVREELGQTGAGLAEMCRGVGLNWDRPTVTRIEQGKRQVTASELLLLTLVYRRPLADLLPAEPSALSAGNRATTATPDALRDALVKPPGVGAGWHITGLFEDALAALPKFAERLERDVAKVPGASAITVLEASEHAGDDTTAKAARALGATPLEVATAAQLLWDHGVAAERDARTEALGPSPNVRTRQARRGHVTRRLLAELRPMVEQVRQGTTEV